ncbi:MAG: histidinol-phosphate transaminase [Sandaracinaceae bacterium]
MRRLVPENVERLVPYSPGKPIEELERELGIKNAVKLASNENPRGPSPLAIEAMRAAATAVNRYPDAATFELRRELAEHHGLASMDELVMGNGSNELIDLICRTYAGPEDHAVIGVPSFVCYHLGLTTANVPYDAVPLREHLFWDLPDGRARRTSAPCRSRRQPEQPDRRPRRPRGARQAFLRSCPPSVLVAFDEAYVEFKPTRALRLGSCASCSERLIVLRTFSKAYGLAANRVGYAIGRPDVVGYLNRTRAPFNVGSISQAAARAALKDPGHVAEYVELNRTERARVTAALEAMGLRVAPSQANFVFVDFARDNREVYDRMLRMGVIIRPMPKPVDTWLRITIGLPEENDRLIGAVRELVG